MNVVVQRTRVFLIGREFKSSLKWINKSPIILMCVLSSPYWKTQLKPFWKHDSLTNKFSDLIILFVTPYL